MTPAEAYLPHWILEGNTDPARNLLWGDRAILFTRRRPAPPGRLQDRDHERLP